MIDQFTPEVRKQALQYLTTVMDTDGAALADGVSEKENHQVNCCPHCKSTSIHKYGMAKKTGSQRYRCKDCGKTFTATTETLFYCIKKPERFIASVFYRPLRTHPKGTGTARRGYAALPPIAGRCAIPDRQGTVGNAQSEPTHLAAVSQQGTDSLYLLSGQGTL